ncbi:MFS general substrate transporter [Cucurbitaria berberidis CBS 394.84]|uniref:MFS general substrate transporter n=1 Tax=Cucurbitaria berberidis CBS 394.84 TaxID=1168544 RepID=A0A9P4GTC2_9PLEO|nr:MFS general substrate transporter [Cucurbitaria berberidis CBS 394.84]KAF1850691.1 MFS general substrate transporter [Cucurbitaria berberidis CBS 394.84]
MAAVQPHSNMDHSEKAIIAANSDVESSQISTPADYDDLPDPDAGKSPAERERLDKALVRKMDMWLIPWLSLLYLLSFLDRTNIGNARVAHMEKDLKMSSRDYSNALTIFFISYAGFEPLTNIAIKKWSPRVFFTLIILAWGIIMTLMGLVKNNAGLLACRWFLGMAEAGLFPGVNYYLSCWYKRQELGFRAALFFSAAALAGSFGGLLAAAITQMDGVGGYEGWRWIFIIEGIMTVGVGVFCWWMVFDFPDTARFLNADEKLRAQRRLKLDGQARAKVGGIDRAHVMAALRDWKTWGYAVIYMGCLCPLYCFSLFLPTILLGMGYKGTKAQLLSVPPYAVAATMTVITGWVADKTKWRGYCNMVVSLTGCIGFAMLLATSNVHVQYAGTFLGAVGIYPTVSNTLTWASNNVEGSLKRGVMVGVVVGWGNLNGVVSSNIYIAKEKPRYYTGHGIVLAYMFLFLFGGSVFMHFALKRENKLRKAGKRDHWLHGKTEDEIVELGDVRPDFYYTT